MWKNICQFQIKTAGSKNKTLPPQAPPSLHNGTQIRKACYILCVSKRGVSVQEIFTPQQASPACSVRLERERKTTYSARKNWTAFVVCHMRSCRDTKKVGGSIVNEVLTVRTPKSELCSGENFQTCSDVFNALWWPQRWGQGLGTCLQHSLPQMTPPGS